jgi:hypothetical protein
MSPQDNPVSFIVDNVSRWLSFAHLHGVYWKLLVWPHFLNYDYSLNALPHLTRCKARHSALAISLFLSFTDVRLLLALFCYTSVSAWVAAALRHVTLPNVEDRRFGRSLLISSAWMLLTFVRP